MPTDCGQAHLLHPTDPAAYSLLPWLLWLSWLLLPAAPILAQQSAPRPAPHPERLLNAADLSTNGLRAVARGDDERDRAGLIVGRAQPRG